MQSVQASTLVYPPSSRPSQVINDLSNDLRRQRPAYRPSSPPVAFGLFASIESREKGLQSRADELFLVVWVCCDTKECIGVLQRHAVRLSS